MSSLSLASWPSKGAERRYATLPSGTQLPMAYRDFHAIAEVDDEGNTETFRSSSPCTTPGQDTSPTRHIDYHFTSHVTEDRLDVTETSPDLNDSLTNENNETSCHVTVENKDDFSLQNPSETKVKNPQFSSSTVRYYSC